MCIEMLNLNVALLDDDIRALSLIQNCLESLLKEKGVNFQIQSFSDSKTFLKQDCSFDILFCDIEMPNRDGIDISNEYKNKNKDCEIIFVSNREDKVFDSLKVHPFGFIRKKNFLSDIQTLIDSYFKMLDEKKHDDYIVITFNSKITKLKINDIMYIESRKKNQLIHLVDTDSIITVVSTMKDFEEQLKDYGFILTHKAFLVNYKFIKDIGLDNIRMTNGDLVYLSKRKSHDVKTFYLMQVQKDRALIF